MKRRCLRHDVLFVSQVSQTFTAPRSKRALFSRRYPKILRLMLDRVRIPAVPIKRERRDSVSGSLTHGMKVSCWRRICAERSTVSFPLNVRDRIAPVEESAPLTMPKRKAIRGREKERKGIRGAEWSPDTIRRRIIPRYCQCCPLSLVLFVSPPPSSPPCPSSCDAAVGEDSFGDLSVSHIHLTTQKSRTFLFIRGYNRKR